MTAVSQDEDISWRHRYAVARDRLLAGDFADAADRFDTLAREARAPQDRILAANMRDVARSWAERGLVLVKGSALGESTLSAKSVGERSTDEIAQLYANSVAYGIGTGLWIDAHTNPWASSGPTVLPLLLGAGAAVGTVALLDIGHPLHYGVPQSIVSGMYIGFEDGLVLGLWGLSQNGSRWSGTTVADVTWGLATVGAVGGGLLGTALGTTPGRASFVGSCALWTGVVSGFAAAALTGAGQDGGTNGLLAAEIGLNAGAIAGFVAAGPVSPSIARVRFLDVGAIGGWLLFGGLYLAASNSQADGRVFSAMTALGVASGLGVVWAATSRMPADRLEPDRQETRTSLSFEPALMPVKSGATLGVRGSL
jgi:hypothetical protein